MIQRCCVSLYGVSLSLWCTFCVCRVINLYVFKPSVTKIEHPLIPFPPRPSNFLLKAVKLVWSPGTLSQVWEETALTPPPTPRGGLDLLSVNRGELILTEAQSSRYWCPHLLGSILVFVCESVCVCVCVCIRQVLKTMCHIWPRIPPPPLLSLRNPFHSLKCDIQRWLKS